MTGPNGGGAKEPEGLLTVIIALVANALIAVAKSIVAMITGSASMVAEAAHSWADTGNEVLLLIAERRSVKPRDDSHPLGYGREAYVWSMVAAFGLFTAGSILSITHGISQLSVPGEEEMDYRWAYIVLAISFVLEGISFTQAVRQTRSSARAAGMRSMKFVLQTSETTLRAVFFEDFAALIGLLIAGAGIGLHQLTGNEVFDAVGSILVGVLLGVVALILIVRNGQFLVGQTVDQRIRNKALRALLARPDIDRVTYLWLEYVGPSRLYLVAAVDLSRDDAESVLQGRMQAIEDELERADFVERARLTLSAPDEPALAPTDPDPDRVPGTRG
ncbi:cation transporter [Enemella dayhoffiae]|uniref:Cation transporter n=1 Tax=Enemella dayhoffiae TaxID=2016507 RepID=A0A255HBS0_9ACTN|nr:cation diffusion facilitator family transporter [Enemella dayhoffiae]OYO25149.1 cation transporter [Enemella dayhoffiae]